MYVHSPQGEPPTYYSLFNHMVKAGGSSIKDRLLHAVKTDGVHPPGDQMHKPQFVAPFLIGFGNLSLELSDSPFD